MRRPSVPQSRRVNPRGKGKLLPAALSENSRGGVQERRRSSRPDKLLRRKEDDSHLRGAKAAGHAAAPSCGAVHREALRSDLGPEGIYPEATGQEGGVRGASYSILTLSPRTMPPGDVMSFVYSKWLRSLRYGNDFFKLVYPDAYWARYKTYLANLFASHETRLRLAVLTDDPDVILGFAVSRGTILEYVYVHKHQRKLGIGTHLVPPGIDTVTHLTKTGLTIWGSKYGSWKFNPFA